MQLNKCLLYLLIFLLICILIKLYTKQKNRYDPMEYFSHNKDIDIVYSWVTSTPEYIKRRVKYSKENSVELGNDINRYDSMDELKYSIRSIYKYAHWVNCIYVVCDDDQVPEWLNIDFSYSGDNIPVKIVKVSEIYGVKFSNDLPTFNSQSIELHIHKIPQLKNKFIYFCDDMLLGNYCKPTDFFSPQGNPMYLFKGKLPTIKNDGRNQHRNAWMNNITILDTIFPKSKNSYGSRDKPAHHGIPLLKTSYDEVWSNSLIYKNIINTSSSKFRRSDNIYLIGLIVYWNIYKGNAGYSGLTNKFIELTTKKGILKDLNNILIHKPQQFCINDNIKNTENRTELNKIMIEFFKSYFPKHSPMELI
jgi:hypothetical protein